MLTYALISSKSDDVQAVCRNIKLSGKGAVRRLFVTYGAYDILLELKADDEALMKDLLNSIRGIDGIVNLKTLKVVHKTRAEDQIPKYLTSY